MIEQYQYRRKNTFHSIAIGENTTRRKCWKIIKNNQKQPLECSIKKAVLKNFAIFIVKILSWSLFLTKLFQHRCFPVNIAKFLSTPILKSICQQLLLNVDFNSNEEQHFLVKLDEKW